MCHTTTSFQSRYHMPVHMFERLVNTLNIYVNEDISRSSAQGNNPITPAMIVSMGLRYTGSKNQEVFGGYFWLQLCLGGLGY